MNNTNTNTIMSAIKSQIDSAVKDGANLLLPQQILSEIPAMHNVTVEYVQLSSKVDEGDIYPKQGDDKKFILTKQGIMKLCACAGVEWNWQYCGRTDNGKDRDYISYRVVGMIRKLDGTWMSLQGEYDLDFEVLEDDLREQYKAKCKNWNKSQAEKEAYVEASTRKELIRLRRYKMGRCETGAMLRALRGLLTLKNSYTKTELEKPFVIARLAFQPDYNDPEIRKQFVSAATQAISGVFGGSKGLPAPSPINITPEPELDAPETSDQNDDISEPSEDDIYLSDEIDFANADDDQQVSTLKELAEKTGTKLSDVRLSPEHKSKRLDLYKYLKSLPEIAPNYDDIPF